MFNADNLATEVFGVLRSFDYTVNIFDFDGNRVFEPNEARRFFATPKNITVSIHEEGENSVIKMFLSQSTNISEVSGLISTMRTVSAKFGVLFNVRKYERELKPKDLSPNSGIEYETGVSVVEKGDDPQTEKVDAVKLDAVTDDIKVLTQELGNLAKHLRGEREDKVKKMDKKNLQEKKGAEMIFLPALGASVEVDAWAQFKDNHLVLYSAPEEFSDDQFRDEITGKVLKLKAVAGKVAADGMANMLSKVADAIEHGSTSKLHMAIADRAIALAYDAPSSVEEPTSTEREEEEKNDDEELKEKRSAEMIHLPALDLDVEKEAWEELKDGRLEIRSPINFEVKLGSSVHPDAFFLRQIADVTKFDGLANMFARIADDIDNGDRTPLKRHIAKVAIAAAKNDGQANLNEGLIVTESIREFGRWFDSLSTTAIFETDYSRLINDPDPLNGSFEMAMEMAWEAVHDNFDIGNFLDTAMVEEFNFGDEELTDEEKELTRDDVKSALQRYIEKELKNELEGEDYSPERDIENMADIFLPEVIDEIEAAGWVVTNEKLEECGEETELKNEDVLLPKNPKDDLSREVSAQRDDKEDEEARRIISLARPKTL